MEEIKIKIGQYEISVKARNTLLQSEYNEEETMSLLNRLSFIFDDAADEARRRYKENPTREYLPRLAERRDRISQQIYEQLDEMHFYDVREEMSK